MCHKVGYPRMRRSEEDLCSFFEFWSKISTKLVKLITVRRWFSVLWPKKSVILIMLTFDHVCSLVLKGECATLHIQVHLIHIFYLPHGARALQFSVALRCYTVQIHLRLTYKTPGLEESIIAPLTLLLHPPLLAFLPSLINRPALGALQLSSLSLRVCVCVCGCVYGHCVYIYLHMCACMGVFVCLCVCRSHIQGNFHGNLCH